MSAAVVVAVVGGLLTAAPASATTVTCSSPVFKRQFFANATFSGTAKRTDCDSAINESWGAGAPAPGLPSNHFSVRWTVTRDFGSGGPFVLTAEAQDGIRVYIDSTRRIDIWKNVSTAQRKSVNVTIPSGRHTLRIDYVNWTGSASAKFSYTPRTSAAIDKVKPFAPTGVSANYSASTTKATIKWAKNPEMDLAGYRVYRRPSGSSTWTRVANTAATSYTDAPAATGQSFSYEVRAYDKAGNVSAGSSDQRVTTADRTPPARVAPPTVVMGTDRTRESYVVSWHPVPDAVRYRVRRLLPGEDYAKPWTVVATTTGTSVTDYVPATGGTVFYRVEAYDAAGNVTTAQAHDEGYANAFWAARATDVTASYRGDNSALLQWTLPKDTFVLSWDDVRLLRSVDTPSTEETTAPQYCTQLSYVDAGDQFRFSCVAEVTLGETNYFAVEPYFSESFRALPSAVVSVTAPSAPAPATNFTGAIDGSFHGAVDAFGVDFTWTASPSADVDHYELHCGFWHAPGSPANQPTSSIDDDGTFYTLATFTIPGDATNVRWPYLLTQQEDFTLVAVAKDGTRLSADLSPRLRMSPPTAG